MINSGGAACCEFKSLAAVGRVGLASGTGDEFRRVARWLLGYVLGRYWLNGLLSPCKLESLAAVLGRGCVGLASDAGDEFKHVASRPLGRTFGRSWLNGLLSPYKLENLAAVLGRGCVGLSSLLVLVELARLESGKFKRLAAVGRVELASDAGCKLSRVASRLFGWMFGRSWLNVVGVAG